MSELVAACYEAARQESFARAAATPLPELERLISELPDGQPSFADAIASHEGVGVVAEHKRKSPGGESYPDRSIAWTVQQYQQGGAVALSILTEKAHFGGRLEDLVEAGKATDLPVLRKDFISNPYQLYEAKAFGATAVLLIAAGLSKDELSNLASEAGDIGLDYLVEIHDEEELDKAMDVDPRMVTVNNRQVMTEERRVDMETTRRLAVIIPRDVLVVAKSGYSVRDPETMDELKTLGIDAVLVGSSLLQEQNPAEALRKWTGA